MAARGSTTSARARQMRRVLAQWERSGLTLTEFGRRRKIAPSTLTWWRQVFRRADKPSFGARRAPTRPAFTEVPLGSSGPLASAGLEIVLRSGHVVRVPPGVEVAALRAVVAALETGC